MLNTQYSSPSLVPLEENQQDQTHLIPFFPSHEPSPFRYPINHHQDHNPPLKVEEHMPRGAPNDVLILRLMPGGDDDHDNNYKKKEISNRSIADNSGNLTTKWMSSKMRIMRKMMNSDSQQVQQSSTGESSSCSNGNSSSSNVNGIIRVCSDCSTTKTPLWRTGPQGPKSLCNACGIRQRKARKAMAALTEKQNSATNTPAKPKLTKEKGSNSGSGIVPYKKRFQYKLDKPTKKIGFEDFGIGLNQSSGFHPQDEKEAAILLMAMSCDLIFG